MENQCDNQRIIYHFLRRAFRQQIPIPQIVDFDIFNEVSIRDVHLAVDIRSGSTAILFDAQARSDRGYIDMLNSLPSLELGINSSGGGSYYAC